MIYKLPMVKLSFVNELSATERKKVTGSREAADLFRQLYEAGTIEHKEFFFAMYMNRAGHFLGLQKISEGGVSSTVVDVKIIIQAAILANASCIIVCHNHPSGTLKPSSQDIDLTRRLQAAAKLFDIQISDHLILTESSYFSFADDGVL